MILATATSDSAFGTILVILAVVLSVGVGVFELWAIWRIFQKAGQPGWAALVPIYNYLIWLRIAGRPWWWLLLALIPGVNLVLYIVVVLDIAKWFGKGTGFAIGLIFLSGIFVPILGFGDASYRGPGATRGGPMQVVSSQA